MICLEAEVNWRFSRKVKNFGFGTIICHVKKIRGDTLWAWGRKGDHRWNRCHLAALGGHKEESIIGRLCTDSQGLNLGSHGSPHEHAGVILAWQAAKLTSDNGKSLIQKHDSILRAVHKMFFWHLISVLQQTGHRGSILLMLIIL